MEHLIDITIGLLLGMLITFVLVEVIFIIPAMR